MSLLRPGLPRIGRSIRQFQRSLHYVPGLPHDFKDGIPEFLSPAAFNIAWTQYQGLMVQKLNMLTAGGAYGEYHPKDIAIKYARDPNSAPIFNYASMAHNNHFFFSCLSPKETSIPEALKKELETSFSSIESLKREMVVTASSMFGPGFVWLVKTLDTGSKRYSLLTTYLAGSPYPGAHARRQATDMNTEEDASSVSAHIRNVIKSPAVNTVGSHGAQSKKMVAPGGIDVTPVLCLNTWEHVYLPDYGVGDPETGAGGKRTYAENWWRKIDWNAVYSNGLTKSRGFAT